MLSNNQKGGKITPTKKVTLSYPIKIRTGKTVIRVVSEIDTKIPPRIV